MDIPQNAIGLPKSVDYTLPPSLSSSANARFVTIAPNGITQTSTITTATTPFTVNSGGAQQPFIQQLFAFDIPCGTVGTFIDPTETTLNFRFVWTVSTAQVGGAGLTCNIISSLASFISSIVLYSNNMPLETINNHDLLFHLLLSSTVNSAQREANLWQMGASTDCYTGVDLPVSNTGTYYFNCSIPLLSLIGINGNNKLFPVGLINSLQLQVLTNQFLPISTYCTTAPTTMPVATVTLDNWSLSMKYVDLGAEATRMLQQNIQGGKLYLKATTYTNSNATIPTNSSGSQSLLLQLRNSSIKSIFALFGTQTAPAISPNYLYDSFNPSLTSVQLSIPANGIRLPNKPLNPTQRPAETMNHLMMAWGSGPASTYGGVVSTELFNVLYPSTYSGADSRMIVPASGVRAFYNGDNASNAYKIISQFPSSFALGFDCEITDSVLFSGVNSRTSPPQLDIVIATAMTQTVQCTAFALIDCVLAFDVESRSVMVFN